MFYLENEKWVPYKKKIVRTVTTISYSDTSDGQPEDAVITDVILTNEQKERLILVNEVEIPNYEITAFVIDGTEPESPEVRELIANYNREKATDELIASLPKEVIADQVELLKKIVGEWDGNGKFYKAGKPLKYNGVLYTVLPPGHTSQPDWLPDKAVSLFAKVLTSPAGPLPWVQPDSTNPYKIGDKVTYKGVVWTSKINANITIPDGDVPYNRYWTDK